MEFLRSIAWYERKITSEASSLRDGSRLGIEYAVRTESNQLLIVSVVETPSSLGISHLLCNPSTSCAASRELNPSNKYPHFERACELKRSDQEHSGHSSATPFHEQSRIIYY